MFNIQPIFFFKKSYVDETTFKQKPKEEKMYKKNSKIQFYDKR